jgi:hypothetical protein
MDIKLLQTFKRINMEAAMKVHTASKGLVPAASSSAMHSSASGSNLRSENLQINRAQFSGIGFVAMKTLYAT